MMQSYSYDPSHMGLNGDKKNFVFVDEHNRHKRLKVMRACESCRKRKIKCDAATTNQWPCGSCVRLKSSCNPPAINHDRDHVGSGNISGLERVLDFDNSSVSGDDDYPHQNDVPSLFETQGPPDYINMPQQAYGTDLGSFNTPPYSDTGISQQAYSYDDITSMAINAPDTAYHDPTAFRDPHSNSLPPSDYEQYHHTDLSDALGELKINENGVAPYISQQKKTLAETPAFEEVEAKLPASIISSGSVRIPPDLMPSEEQCMEYFEIFFTHVHPYVPVISKPYFYQQWRSNRMSISPLILEAIFACAGRMSSDASEGANWLALSARHEDCFMDVPRLSTVQALLLLLKARESAPKRGYYYRSWMTVKKLVTMAHDLELHDHYSEHHVPGRRCTSDPTECLIKTRIWQTIFICEMMIGGPQGRHDMGVDPDTVDLEIHRPSPGIDSSDYQISRQFTYLVRKVTNVRVMHDLKGNSKQTPQNDWVADPKFVNLSSILDKWLEELPRDLQVDFPDNETPPWLPSHFVGNMHSYYHLTVIMLHRPQLMHSSSYADGSWKQHMVVCYASSKAMCRLQEAILQKFGIPGLLCMQRGINFVIYAVLTCTMVHLVAVTSPDPAFNSDARDYFTRHMRILENCTSAWPQPEMQSQIDALRDAFSADTNRPFQLKASFPFGSPGPTGLQASPAMETNYNQPMLSRPEPISHIPQMSYGSQSMTSPTSAGLQELNDRSLASSTTAMISNSNVQLPLQTNSISNGPIEWNPTPIFNNWTAAFGPNSASTAAMAASMPQQSPPLYPPASVSSHGMTSLHDTIPPQQQLYHMPSNMTPGLGYQSQTSSRLPDYSDLTHPFVTPSMWRDTVASAYDPGGLKRRWNADASLPIDSVQSKRPR